MLADSLLVTGFVIALIATAMIGSAFRWGALISLLCFMTALIVGVWHSPKVAALLCGAGAGVRGFSLSLIAVVGLGWLATTLTYRAFATPPELSTGDLVTAIKTQVDKASSKISLTKPVRIQVAHGIKQRQVFIEIRFVKPASADEPEVEHVLARIQLADEVTPASALSRPFCHADRKVSCRIDLVAMPKAGDFEVSLPPFSFYELAAASALTPNTFTLNTPAAVHVFEKALLYVFAYVNDESPSMKGVYSKDDLAEQVCIRQLFAVINETVGTIPTTIQWQRKMNGYIQWSSVLAFFALMIQLVARYATYYWWDRRLVSDTCRDEFDRLRVISRTKMVEENPRYDGERKHAIAKSCLLGCYTTPSLIDLFLNANAAFTVSGDYKDVPGFVDSRTAALMDERSARQGFVRYLLWSIPSIGFIGTVVGIGNALLATMDVDAVNPIASAVAKSTVSSNIGVAFDTTLVALLLSMVGMLVYNVVAQFEELIVSANAKLVLDKFIQAGDQSTADLQAIRLTHELLGHWDKLEKATNGLADLGKSAATMNAVAGRIADVTKQHTSASNGSVENIVKATKQLVSVSRESQTKLDGFVSQVSAMVESIQQAVGGRSHLGAWTLAIAFVSFVLIAYLFGSRFFPWP